VQSTRLALAILLELYPGGSSHIISLSSNSIALHRLPASFYISIPPDLHLFILSLSDSSQIFFPTQQLGEAFEIAELVLVLSWKIGLNGGLSLLLDRVIILSADLLMERGQ
jgi:hypothetical protein